VLIAMGVLSKEQYEDWRRGRVPYLERVCQINLGKLSTIDDSIENGFNHRAKTLRAQRVRKRSTSPFSIEIAITTMKSALLPKRTILNPHGLFINNGATIKRSIKKLP
jgi:hypothetical protein